MAEVPIYPVGLQQKNHLSQELEASLGHSKTVTLKQEQLLIVAHTGNSSTHKAEVEGSGIEWLALATL